MSTTILIPLNSKLWVLLLLWFVIIFILMSLIWNRNRSGWKWSWICVWISSLRNFFATSIVIPFDCPKWRRFFLWFPFIRNWNRPWRDCCLIPIVYSSCFKTIPPSSNWCSLFGNSLEKWDISSIIPVKIKLRHLLLCLIVMNL